MSGIPKKTVLAIDAGGTYFKSALISEEGRLSESSFFQAPASSGGTKDEIMASYGKILEHALEYSRNYGTDIRGIGISTPGPFDYGNGMSLMTHKFQSIKGISLRDEIYSLGVFTEKAPVVFMQDVHAFLSGEHWTGAVKDFQNIAAVTLGTGLGFGIMKGGRILDNGKGGPCISIFNRPYKDGILEDIASRRGIITRYRQYSGNEDPAVDVRDIAESAENGDAEAVKVFHETGEILAGELAGIFKEHDIEAVVFGGQISKSFGLFGTAFQEKLNDSGKGIKALPGKNIDYSSLSGVARMLFSRLRE